MEQVSDEREQLRNRYLSITLILISGVLGMSVYLYLIYLIYNIFPYKGLKTDFRRLYSVTSSVEDYASKYRINVGNYSAQNLLFYMKFAPEREPVSFKVSPFKMHLYLEDSDGHRLTPRHKVRMPIKFRRSDRIGVFTTSAIPLYHLKKETDVKVCIEYKGNSTYIYGQHFHLQVPLDSMIYYEMTNSFEILNNVLTVAFIIAITQSILIFKKNQNWFYSVLLIVFGYASLFFWKRKESFLSDLFFIISIALSRSFSVVVAMPKIKRSTLVNIIFIAPVAVLSFFVTRMLDINGSDWISPIPVNVIGPIVTMTLMNISILFLLLFLLVIVLMFRKGPQMASDSVLICFSTIICVHNLVLDVQRIFTDFKKVVFPAFFFRDRYISLFGIALLSLFASSPIEFGATASYKRLPEAPV